MPDFNWRNLSPRSTAGEMQPDVHSADVSEGATPGSSSAGSQPCAPGAPQPVIPHGALEKMKRTLSRARHALGARRVDVSTAFYQHTKHGHSSGSTRFVQSGKRGEASAPIAETAGNTPRIDTARLVSQVIESPSVRTGSDAYPAVLFVETPLDTITSAEALRAYVRQLFEDRSHYGAQASVLARTALEVASGSTLPPRTEAAAAMRGALLALALRQAGITHAAAAHSALERLF